MWVGFKGPTHSHSKGKAEPQSLTEIRLPLEELGPMREDDIGELCTLRWDDVARTPTQNSFVWRDAVKHRHAVMTLARQLAFNETGEVTVDEIAAHLKEHQSRLLAEAEKMIQMRQGLARWRFKYRR